jgi:hypothetical protein
MTRQLLLKFRAALVITVTIALATSALAQATVVTGTGNPGVDVPAVQTAVNLGGEVVLSGHFSLTKGQRSRSHRISISRQLPS